jgi:hypothetical protein
MYEIFGLTFASAVDFGTGLAGVILLVVVIIGCYDQHRTKKTSRTE